MNTIIPTERPLFKDMPLRQDSRRIIQNVTDLLAERVKNVHPDMEMSVNSTHSNTDSVLTAYVAIDCVADDIRRSAQLFLSSIPSRDTFLCNVNDVTDALLYPKNARPSKRQYALPFLPEGMNVEVAKLVDAFVQEPSPEVAHEIMKLGIGMRMSILPRGTMEESAENRLPKLESLPPILDVLRTAQDTELIHYTLHIVSEWADGSAVPEIIALMQRLPSEEMTLACLHALEHIGGKEAVITLKELVSNGETLRVRRSAEHSLSQLECGGTFDYQEGTSIEDLSEDERREHYASMKRIPLP